MGNFFLKFVFFFFFLSKINFNWFQFFRSSKITIINNVMESSIRKKIKKSISCEKKKISLSVFYHLFYLKKKKCLHLLSCHLLLCRSSTETTTTTASTLNCLPCTISSSKSVFNASMAFVFSVSGCSRFSFSERTSLLCSLIIKTTCGDFCSGFFSLRFLLLHDEETITIITKKTTTIFIIHSREKIKNRREWTEIWWFYKKSWMS